MANKRDGVRGLEWGGRDGCKGGWLDLLHKLTLKFGWVAWRVSNRSLRRISEGLVLAKTILICGRKTDAHKIVRR